MEDVVRKLGFESEQEFHKLVASVNLTEPIIMLKFRQWQKNDGTKAGLLKVINYQLTLN